MIDPEPTIDSATDEAARVLAETHGVDYYHASGQHQAYWRHEAQTAVCAWQEYRRRCAEENVPSPTPTAPSLRAELAEAQATIARLTEEMSRKDSAKHGYGTPCSCGHVRGMHSLPEYNDGDADLKCYVNVSPDNDSNENCACPGWDPLISMALVRDLVSAVEEGKG